MMIWQCLVSYSIVSVVFNTGFTLDCPTLIDNERYELRKCLDKEVLELKGKVAEDSLKGRSIQEIKNAEPTRGEETKRGEEETKREAGGTESEEGETKREKGETAEKNGETGRAEGETERGKEETDRAEGNSDSGNGGIKRGEGDTKRGEGDAKSGEGVPEERGGDSEREEGSKREEEEGSKREEGGGSKREEGETKAKEIDDDYRVKRRSVREAQDQLGPRPWDDTKNNLCREFSIIKRCTKEYYKGSKSCLTADEKKKVEEHFSGLKKLIQFQCTTDLQSKQVFEEVEECEKQGIVKSLIDCNVKEKFNRQSLVEQLIPQFDTADMWTDPNCDLKRKWLQCVFKVYDTCKTKSAATTIKTYYLTIYNATCKIHAAFYRPKVTGQTEEQQNRFQRRGQGKKVITGPPHTRGWNDTNSLENANAPPSLEGVGNNLPFWPLLVTMLCILLLIFVHY